MSLWRKEAVVRIPKLQKMIQESETVGQLWVELWSKFHGAYRESPPDEDIIAGIYSYAQWCLQAERHDEPSHDPYYSAVGVFFDTILKNPASRKDAPRWFSRGDISQNPGIFCGFDQANLNQWLDELSKEWPKYIGKRPRWNFEGK